VFLCWTHGWCELVPVEEEEEFQINEETKEHAQRKEDEQEWLWGEQVHGSNQLGAALQHRAPQPGIRIQG
jgi:hypothetical protein